MSRRLPVALCALALSISTVFCSTLLSLLILVFSFTMVSVLFFIIVPYNRPLLISDIPFGSPGALGKIAILESLLGSLELRMYRYPSSPL